MPAPERKGRRRLERKRRSPLSWLAIVLAPLTLVAGTWIVADLVALGGDRPTASVTRGTPGAGTSPTGTPTAAATSSPVAVTTPSLAPTQGPRAPRIQKVVKGRTLKPFTPAELAAIAEREAMEQAARQPISFRIGTFNLLGSNHTAPGGERRSYPPASVRTPRTAAKIAEHRVDVLGTQELKPDQLNALKSMTGMAAYPDFAFGTRDTDNNILYDPDLFEFVEGGSFTITFMNARRPQTILKLRHRETGREMYFLNMHASAGGGKYAASRAAGHQTAIATVNSLKAEGLPVFLTGDMNDRQPFFCRLAPATGMVAAIGGSTSGGCAPARALAVDWVLAHGATFSGYWEDRSTLRRTSDHHFISADTTVPPAS